MLGIERREKSSDETNGAVDALPRIEVRNLFLDVQQSDTPVLLECLRSAAEIKFRAAQKSKFPKSNPDLAEWGRIPAQFSGRHVRFSDAIKTTGVTLAKAVEVVAADPAAAQKVWDLLPEEIKANFVKQHSTDKPK